MISEYSREVLSRKLEVVNDELESVRREIWKHEKRISELQDEALLLEGTRASLLSDLT